MRVVFYVKRFVVKEVCLKVFGSGIWMGVVWCEMGVVNLLFGKLIIVFIGGVVVCL